MEVSSALVLQLTTALRECARHAREAHTDQRLDELDVGILALADAERGHLRPSRAVAALDVAFPSVTRHVRGLRDRGLITVAPDAEDGRGYAIALSADGERALRAHGDELAARFGPALADWSAAEVTALVAGLTRLAVSMASATTRRAPAPASWWRTP